MRESGVLCRLAEKQVNIERLVEEVMGNEELLCELLDGVSSRDAKVKFRSAKLLRKVSELHPEKLYSKWEFFVKLLDSENNILKWNAMDIIANLTKADSQDKFKKLFGKFYRCLTEGSLITAGHVIDNSGRIALAKPELQDRITEELLKVEAVSVPTEECRNILIGKTITTFDAYCDKIRNDEEVIAFVERQLNNSRKATKAKAQKLLKKLEAHRTR